MESRFCNHHRSYDIVCRVTYDGNSLLNGVIFGFHRFHYSFYSVSNVSKHIKKLMSEWQKEVLCFLSAHCYRAESNGKIILLRVLLKLWIIFEWLHRSSKWILNNYHSKKWGWHSSESFWSQCFRRRWFREWWLLLLHDVIKNYLTTICPNRTQPWNRRCGDHPNS